MYGNIIQKWQIITIQRETIHETGLFGLFYPLMWRRLLEVEEARMKGIKSMLERIHSGE